MQVEPATSRAAWSRPGTAIWAGIVTVTVVAWLIVVVQAERSGSGMAMGAMAPLPFLAVWVPMMAAMMFPSVAPVAGLWTRAIAYRSTGAVATARVAGFLCGYLLAWAAFGVVALVAERALTQAADALGPATARWIGVAVFAAAGIYQFTPLKDRCLRACSSPLGQFLRYAGLRGRAVDVRVGLMNGAWCIACCWGLMAVLVVVGVMSFPAMIAVAVAIFAEKVSRHGRAASRLVGVGLLACAALAPFVPALVPTLHAMGSGSM